MINVADEIIAIETFLKTILPDVKFFRQHIPNKPKKNEMAIRFLRGETSTETNFHYRIEHDFQMIYFGADSIDVISKLDMLTRKLNNAIKIQVNEGQFLTTGSFSMSAPFVTEGGVDAVIAVLTVTLREAREQVVVPKMSDIQVRDSEEVGTWQLLDGTATTNTTDDRTWDDVDDYTMRDLEKGVYLFEEEE